MGEEENQTDIKIRVKYTRLPANHISRVSRMNERAIEFIRRIRVMT